MTAATPRRGMSLVEMLVAMAATLLLMAAVARVFALVGTAFTNSRALLELDARMRTAAWSLRDDLSRATVATLPPRGGAAADGYLEIIEGPQTDASNPAGADAGPADCDDLLAFTIARGSDPLLKLRPSPGATSFIPWTPGMSMSSGDTGDNLAAASQEVVWFLRPDAAASNPPRYVLCRRSLRVRNYLQELRIEPTYFPPHYTYRTTQVPTNKANSTYVPDNRRTMGAGTVALSAWWDSATSGLNSAGVNPVYSLRREGNWLFPNSLADLARRENRVVHNITGTAAFPFVMQDSGTFLAPAGTLRKTYGDIAVVLHDVLAFDVRVFDPTAPVAVAAGRTPLVPGDPGYTAAGAAVACGGYVDLGHGTAASELLAAKGVGSWFGGDPDPKSGLAAADPSRRTYDTWSRHYEINGRDEDGDGLIDEGTNALDDDGDGSVDEADEQETSAPYPVPLRAIEVRLRCYEPTSRQVRQMTIRHAFTP
jgi:prepilin-type N-terminal cleavage/methylation domain-containing protein